MVAKRASRIIQGAREALAFATGDADAADFVVHVSPAIDVKAIRSGFGMTQATFASTFGLSVLTVEDWEHGRSIPNATGRAYLRVIQARPEAVKEALAATSSHSGP